MPGPVPKREAQRRRVNKPEVPVTHAEVAAPVVQVPAADGSWHPLARDWFESLARSGQSQFLEPSDWAQARVWAYLLSEELFRDKASAMMIASWASGAAELLTTEGARRRMRIELERVKPADAGEDHADATVTSLMSRIGG